MVDQIPNKEIYFPQEQEDTFNLPKNVTKAVYMLNNKMTSAESDIRNKIVQLRNDYETLKGLGVSGITKDNT